MIHKLKPFQSREEIIWAAGLFEGEGWISVRKKTPSVGIQMSDKEVLERFAKAVGGGPIYYRKPRIYSYERINSRKEQWAWRVCGLERVQAILVYLWPWLSKRRKLRAREVLQASKSGQPKCGRQKGDVLKVNPHGNVRKYWQGCRCEECLKANRTYSRQLRETKSVTPSQKRF